MTQRPVEEERPKCQEPALYYAGRNGSWAFCVCGWQSKTWKWLQSAVIEWAFHVRQRLVSRPWERQIR